MTNEEALRILHCPSAYLTDEDSELAHTIPMFSRAYGQAMAVAFEALKQADVLDKIRVEIMDFEEELFHRPNTDYTDYAAVRHCVEIIDKYKAGEEE